MVQREFPTDAIVPVTVSTDELLEPAIRAR